MERESFKSSAGSIMALAGSAVGLGNIWRFPYMLSEYGGGAFIMVYILCIIIVALPIMMCEFVVGRHSRANAYSAVSVIDGNSGWKRYGILALCIPFFTLCYYCVIGGWTLQYMFDSCMLQFKDSNPAEIQAMFGQLVSDPIRPIVLDTLFLLITGLIIVKGVNKGIEKCSKVMMPTLFFIMLFMAIWTAFQPGAVDGLAYLFRPDFSKITPRVFLAAMGQSFYSLSIGMGIMITYSSYLDRNSGLTHMAVSTIIADLVFAIIAGSAIIPVLFAYGMPTDQGTGLVFKTLPIAFSKMPFGGLVSVVFFFAVLLAAITSAMSLYEVPVSWLVERMRMSRVKASVSVFCAALFVGVFCSLSFGKLSNFTIGGRILFDAFDYVIGNYLMPMAGLVIVLFVGWKMERKTVFDEVYGIRDSLPGPKTLIWNDVLRFMVRYISPIAIIAIFLWGIFQ